MGRAARHRTAFAAVLCAVLAGCGGDAGPDAQARSTATGVTTSTAVAAGPARRPDRFDEAAAMRIVRLQLRAGPRPAGSPALVALARRLRPMLPRGRFEPVPGESGLRNVVGVVRGTKPAIVIGAHYDVLAKPKGFLGANNGAAGSAIVIQLARTLAKVRRGKGAPELRFVLFDGEEPAQGLPEEQADFEHTGLRGSRAYVAAHPGEVREMILLDYVANRGLRLPREQTSDVALWSRIRAAARRTGNAVFFPDTIGPGITDDHTPFLRAGIPAVDLIDWSYEGHTLADTYDKLSPRSADAVGETLVELLRRGG